MIPLVINIDYQDPESILMSLVQEPGLCFLDSAKQDKELGRFSYIAVDPFELINGDALASQPFEYLNQRLLSYQTESLAELPPFQGGALGYFGYDLLHHLEKIPQPTEDSIRIPSMMIGLYDLVIAFDHLKREAYLISQGFPEKDIEERQERARNRAEWLFDKIQKKNAQQKKQRLIEKESISSNFSKNDYCLAVQKVVDYIYAGDIFQANISQCFSCPLPDKFDLIALYLALRRKNPAPFGAYLKFDDLCIASASPERFIRLDQNKVQTRPIKGTRPRGQTPEQDQSIEI